MTEAESYSLHDAVDQFGAILHNNESFLVAAHINPDGDTIGSMLALGQFLELQGKKVIYYDQDLVPRNFRFLPNASKVVNEVPYTPDVTILVDCGAPARIGSSFPKEGWGETIVVIDHHKTYDPDFAHLYIRDVNASSAGEVVYEVIKKYGTLTLEIATSLYTCIITDTNCFRYSATTSATFKAAGDMLDAGVEPWYMASHLYESQPIERVRLMSRVLNTLTLSESGKLAFLFVSRDLLDEYGATTDLVDGFINYARGIEGVEIATQLLEVKENSWRVSFRSRGNIDSSQLAEQFGGGGHRNSAGCYIQGTCQEVQRKLTEALAKVIATSPDAT